MGDAEKIRSTGREGNLNKLSLDEKIKENNYKLFGKPHAGYETSANFVAAKLVHEVFIARLSSSLVFIIRTQEHP